MKTNEEKLVDSLSNAFRLKDLRHFDIIKGVFDKGYGEDMWHLVTSVLSFMSVYSKYDYYPYGLQEESNFAEEFMDILSLDQNNML